MCCILYYIYLKYKDYFKKNLNKKKIKKKKIKKKTIKEHLDNQHYKNQQNIDIMQNKSMILYEINKEVILLIMIRKYI